MAPTSTSSAPLASSSSRAGAATKEGGPLASEYIRSTTNFVSRKADVQGPQRVEMRGRSVVQPGVLIRGDLALIRVGHYCFFDGGAVLRPCVTLRDGVESHVPLTIGNFTRVGPKAVVEAAYVGSHVEIGAGAVISSRCLLKDCCRIEPGTVLAPDTVVPPYATVSGVPGRIVGELPPSTPLTTRQQAMATYRQVKRAVLGAAGAATAAPSSMGK